MSARNLIYDKRFMQGRFPGHAVDVPEERHNEIFNTTKQWIEWSDNRDIVCASVRRWLADKGPWRQSRGTFYFSREDAAAQFRLAFG
jgi:hypothetical protein